jgi:hypothetical protein
LFDLTHVHVLTVSKFICKRVQEACPEIAHAPGQTPITPNRTHRSFCRKAWRGSKGDTETIYNNPTEGRSTRHKVITTLHRPKHHRSQAARLESLDYWGCVKG